VRLPRDNKLFEYFVQIYALEELVEGFHRHLNFQWIRDGRGLFALIGGCGSFLHIVVVSKASRQSNYNPVTILVQIRSRQYCAKVIRHCNNR